MSAATQRKPPQSEGTPEPKEGWVPAWMVELGIEPNGAVTLSKAQLRSLMRPGRPLKIRVWACGMLHTAGYAGEKAWTMRNGKRDALVPSDISRELFYELKHYYTQAGVKAKEVEAAAETLKESKEEIRSALAELKEEGLGDRKTRDGRSLCSLPVKERQRLSGKTEMFFFARPRHANPEKVRQQWLDSLPSDPISPDDMSKDEVGNYSLPMPPIWQILKGLQIEKPEKAQITDPQYQKRVERAWRRAREVFLEVVEQTLPEVEAKTTPEVGSTGGTLERKGERYIERTGSSSSKEQPTTTITAEQFHEALAEKFLEAGKSVPTRKQCDAIFPSLNGNSESFLNFLTVKKMKRVTHPGVLPSLVEEFRTAQMASARKPKPETEEERQRRYGEDVLAHPEKHDQETRDYWARKLGNQAKGAGS